MKLLPQALYSVKNSNHNKLFEAYENLCQEKITTKGAEQQTRLNSLPTDSASPLVLPINSGKVYMEQTREALAH